MAAGLVGSDETEFNEAAKVLTEGFEVEKKVAEHTQIAAKLLGRAAEREI